VIGWSILNETGSLNAFGAAGSEPSPSGNGILLDDTSLEGQTVAAGSYTPATSARSKPLGLRSSRTRR
jgi:hypothetical protein